MHVKKLIGFKYFGEIPCNNDNMAGIHVAVVYWLVTFNKIERARLQCSNAHCIFQAWASYLLIGQMIQLTDNNIILLPKYMLKL